MTLKEVQEIVAYHLSESKRIQGELDRLGPEFTEDGIVKTILRDRVTQEKELASV